MSFSKISFWNSSGAKIITKSAFSVALSTGKTFKPASNALSQELEPSLKATVTSTPESFKLFA